MDNQVYNEIGNEPKMKGRVVGFLGTALTVLYAIYIISYFGDIHMENLGGMIATALVMPHMICVGLAALFSLVGFFGKKRWAMLTAGILMAVAAIVFMTYAMFVIIQAILLFIAYARMGVYK